MQESQPLGVHLPGQNSGAGRVTARPREAGDQSNLDRVYTDTEHDRDRRGRSFGRVCERLILHR